MIIKLKNINQNQIIAAIKQGKIFIYPTDTVYGLGCNALDEKAVAKLRKIKHSKKPFSVVAISKNWIYENLEIKRKFIEKLPAALTFILKPKKRNLIAKNVNFSRNLGIRIPKHSFTKVIQKAKVPFITTSVNISGKKPITNIKQIPRKIFKQVDFIIDAGILANKPSTVIDLTKKVPKIIRA